MIYASESRRFTEEELASMIVRTCPCRWSDGAMSFDTWSIHVGDHGEEVHPLAVINQLHETIQQLQKRETPT